MEACNFEGEKEGGTLENSASGGVLAKWKALPRRTRLLIGLLILLTGVYAGSQLELAITARALDRVAQKEIDGLHSDTNEVVWETTVSRPYILVGPGQGKVEVFVLQNETADEKPSIHSVSFYYVQKAGAWKLDGSGASGSEETQAKGLKLFGLKNPAALAGP